MTGPSSRLSCGPQGWPAAQQLLLLVLPNLSDLFSNFSLPSLYFASGGGFKQVKTNRDKIMSGIHNFKALLFSNMTQVQVSVETRDTVAALRARGGPGGARAVRAVAGAAGQRREASLKPGSTAH